MKIITFLFALWLPLLAWAGSYEDLEEAFIRNDPEMIIAVINRGMDVNTVDRQGNTLLIQAVKSNNAQVVDYLIKRKARLNARNKNGETALSLAAYLGKLPLVQRLVTAGADVNFFGWSPLAYAAYQGHLDVAKYLIEHGAEVNATTENGSTPLFFAARFGHEDLVKLLLDNDADVSIENENKETVVDWAVKGKNTKIEAILREAGGRSGKTMTLDMSQ